MSEALEKLKALHNETRQAVRKEFEGKSCDALYVEVMERLNLVLEKDLQRAEHVLQDGNLNFDSTCARYVEISDFLIRGIREVLSE